MTKELLMWDGSRHEMFYAGQGPFKCGDSPSHAETIASQLHCPVVGGPCMGSSCAMFRVYRHKERVHESFHTSYEWACALWVNSHD